MAESNKATKQITYMGISYTVGADDTLEDLLKKPGFEAAHAENMKIQARKLIAPSPEDRLKKKEEDEKSGFLTALLAGMSNDQAYQLAWLARRRFPGLLERDGIDPVEFYFVDEDEDIAYVDPNTGRVVKEFKEGLLSDSERTYLNPMPQYDVMDTAGMVGPTLQFFSELGLGTAGMTMGGFTLGIPGAIAGGGAGTGIGGTIANAGRLGISAAFDGPPLNVAQAKEDLMYAAGFGAIPFGSFGAKGLAQTLGSVKSKFVGDDGLTALQTIMREGGTTADEKIDFARDKFGIVLTRGEAEGIINNTAQLQRYLQMQPGSQKLWDFYHNRALQVEEAADEFFDQVLRGDFLTKLKQGRLSGKTGFEFEDDLAEASNRVLEKLAAKRQERADKIYKNAYELELEIDVSDIARQLQMDLSDPNLRGKARTVKQELLDSLTDFSGLSKNQLVTNQGTLALKDNTQMLHNALKNDFRPLIEGLTKDGQRSLKREVSQIRAQISERMKGLNPEYKRATEVYDPSKGHLQALEASIVTNFAKAASIGGETAIRLTDKLFSGKAKPKDIRMLRRLIETEDPQVWQNMKGNWLRTQLDDAIGTTTNPLGATNSFLRRIGFSGRPRQSFNEFLRDNPQITKQQVKSGEASRIFREQSAENLKLRGKKAQALKAIMDPQELQNFVDLVELMQATSFIATKSSSPTQPFTVIQRALEKETGGMGRVAQNALRAVFEIPQRLLVRGFDDMARATLTFQREAYEDQLIQALIDPAFAKELAESINKVKPLVYFTTQAVARGGEEVFENLTEGDFGPGPTAAGMVRGSEGQRTIERAREAARIMDEENQPEPVAPPQSSALPSPSELDLFDPLPVTPATPTINPAMSPTILPSDTDRELAARRAGIAGLV
jgi:hypothetical protein